MEIDYSYFYGMMHILFLSMSKYIKNLYLRHVRQQFSLYLNRHPTTEEINNQIFDVDDGLFIFLFLTFFCYLFVCDVMKAQVGTKPMFFFK